ncbi:capsid maturation protease [Bacillus phage 035JT001]|nr:capsid maturation protease [Bacillus phage 035JT001]
MADRENPLTEDGNVFEDEDRTLVLIRAVVAKIMEHVLSLDDITNDKKKNAMFQAVLSLLDQLGIAIMEVFPQEIATAYTAGHDTGASFLRDAGMDTAQITGNLKDKVHAQAVQEIATQGYDDLQAALRTAGELFIAGIGATLTEIQDKIAEGILLGHTTKTITAAVQQKFLQEGLTSFITRDGKRLPLDFYAMTVTRTKVRDAHTQGAVKRYEENGVDLVRFPTRSHTCKICGERERLVVSISGKTEGYPTVEEIGGLPPWHPNCRHYPMPVIDASEYPPVPFTGRDMRSAESKEVYKNEQAIRQKANNEKKLYLKMKAEAEARGETFPPIGTWRRKKRKDDEEWKTLQKNYRDSIKNIPS